MYKDTECSFSALCDNLRHCETFSKNISKTFVCPPPARIIFTPADNQYACYLPYTYGSLPAAAPLYCFDLMLCKKIVVNFKRVN